MQGYRRQVRNYASVDIATGVASATTIQLTQMLFDGLVDSLAEAKGHMVHGAFQEKAQALSRAARIVVGLQDSLDFARGGDLAKNLNDLYMYVGRRLVHVNARDDLAGLNEVFGLMSEIRDAWKTLQDLGVPRERSFASAH